jgi:hypothetical protein
MLVTLANIISSLTGYKDTTKIQNGLSVGLIALAGIVILGGVLFLADKCSTYEGNKKLKAAQTNANIAMNAVNAAKGTVVKDAVNEAVAVDRVKEAVNDAVTASNATDAAKQRTNQALANYQVAVNANVPVGTSADDLHRALDDLDGGQK